MNIPTINKIKLPGIAEWQEAIARYRSPDNLRSWWQIINSFVPYLALWVLMVYTLEISYWLTLLLAVPAAGLLVRIFIIFHDCGHGSFFKSKRANDTLGFISGILTFTPYYQWRHSHAVHHASAGDLDRRGTGDVWTMTVDEYQQATSWKKFGYRVYRNPFILFGVGALLMFVIFHRFADRKGGQKERFSVYWTNLALVTIIIIMSLTIGWRAYLLVQLPIIAIAASVGVWMFYVQHQFEGVYWERHENWDYTAAALKGSSFYRLPKVIQWFTGNIGFHHIHHLSPKIPNYNLERCHREHAMFRLTRPITLLSSLKSMAFRLWDERNRRLVGFQVLKKLEGT